MDPRAIVDTAVDTIAGGVPDDVRADYRDCYDGDRFVESMRYVRRYPEELPALAELWEIDEHAWLFVEPNAAQAGAGRITLAVAGLDALLERLAAEGIEHEPVEAYSNGVRHVNVPDPGWEHDRVCRTARRGERVSTIG